ncbi:MAG: universal stress protein [Deltaproteobacteria bacterium]|nr:MAG: universal stress protein [Deltaproteobacteria bacterium]TMB32558.1 MAG: universal stress protein [Deltaproteobacteria bacterium]TMB39939.1 MAG: universal stress protein [Deltaproteobacteria bacterium]
MRILVAVDGSDPSRRAATRAADLARRLGESLTVVHVLPPPPIFSEPAVLPDVAELERRVYERGKAVLDEIADSLRHDGLEVQAQLLAGPAAEVLAEAAQSSEVDFVVVGSRGRTLVGSMLLGGTSHRLIHICKKPVLVVH